jgi:hypothetical protein
MKWLADPETRNDNMEGWSSIRVHTGSRMQLLEFAARCTANHIV